MHFVVYLKKDSGGSEIKEVRITSSEHPQLKDGVLVWAPDRTARWEGDVSHAINTREIIGMKELESVTHRVEAGDTLDVYGVTYQCVSGEYGKISFIQVPRENQKDTE